MELMTESGLDSKATIKVCVGNYGYYAQGELRDAWIELPKTDKEIEEFLANHGLKDSTHEEIYISDYDGYPLGIKSDELFNQYTQLGDLNLLAKQIQNDPVSAERVATVFDSGFDKPNDIVGLMNWITQADEIPFYEYDSEGLSDTWTPEEKMGWVALDNYYPELKEMLESVEGALRAFDVEAFGESFTHGCYLCDEGYIDATQDMPAEDYYSFDELKEDIEREWEQNLSPERTSLCDRIADAAVKADTLNAEHTSPDHEINRGDAR